MKLPIYMDNHATTPVDPEVLEAMLPYFSEKFGNAASRNHGFGWEAEEGVETGRKQIADLIGASPAEIIFTSGATESDNAAIKGVAWANRHKGNHIITCLTEHKAVLDSCHYLETQGFEVTYLPVGRDGLVDPEDVRRTITDKTILITIMYANNEIGVIHPIPEVGKIAKERGVLFHCDAVQAIGKIPVNVAEMGVGLMSLSAHKMYGPKAIGALYVRDKRPRIKLEPLIHGGGHERKLRSGTLNVPGIVGFGKACEVAGRVMEEEARRLLCLRDKLYHAIVDRLDHVELNGSYEHRLPGNLNLSFRFVEGESLLMALSAVALSSGSACTSASLEGSYVLKAIGVDEELAHTSIRFGLGRFNTEEEADYVADLVVEKVRRLRELSPLYEMHQMGIDLSKVAWSG